MPREGTDLMKRLLLTALLALPALADDRVETLLRQMTLTEKLGQLQMLDGDWSGTYRPEHPDLIRRGLLGSTLNVRGSHRVNELQRIAVTESRLKIPVLFGFDVIHGYRTQFPIPLAEAATFDPALVEESARIAAREAASTGLKWTFAPMVDVGRDARWGRVAEGSGEDPFLGCLLARARVRGFQGTDPSHKERLMACAKHWVAYGAAEAGRDYNSVDLSERSLREVYFPPFQAAVEEGSLSLMSAFNDLNGVPTSGNAWTLTQVLRKEWGFQGLVVSDYNSIEEMIAHGYAADGAEAARLGITAGVDIEMVSRLYATHLPGLVQRGEVPESVIDESVRRVLRVKERLGLFDQPYVEEGQEERVLLCPEHRAAARKVAAQSIVLLNNSQGLLPLSASLKRVAVLGPLADDPCSTLGCWSADAKPAEVITPLQAMREALGETRVLYAKGVDLNVPGATGNFEDRPAQESNAGGTNVATAEGVALSRLAQTPVAGGAFQEALNLAQKADFTVIFVGETANMSGEAASRTNLDLPGRQLELIQAVAATGKPYAVVLMNGRPLSIGWLAEHAPALLEAWYPGTEGGHAIVDVLLGRVNPGGHLPVSFPRNVGQVPLYYNHKATGKAARPDKYTSKYLDTPTTALYPFGHGLSYSRFELTQLQHQDQEISAMVENQGGPAGDAVVQLYVQDVSARFTRPVKELRGFQRIHLKPGEKRRISFPLGPQQLSMLDEHFQAVVEPGRFRAWISFSSEGGLSTEWTQQGSTSAQTKPSTE